MTRPISEYREALEELRTSINMEWGPEVKTLAAALDELEQARAQVRVLREALEKARACWLYEASQGDGVLEDHDGVLAEIKAALSSAGAGGGG